MNQCWSVCFSPCVGMRGEEGARKEPLGEGRGKRKGTHELTCAHMHLCVYSVSACTQTCLGSLSLESPFSVLSAQTT